MNAQVGMTTRGEPSRTEREMTPLEACDRAESYIEKAGFTLRWQSGKSEARYFSLPSRHGTLRIATHAKRYKEAGPGMDSMGMLGPVVVSVTFPEGAMGKNGLIRITEQCIEHKTATAIGIYLIRASRA